MSISREIEKVLAFLKDTNERVTSDIIETIINDHAPQRARMISLYDRYKAETQGVPILQREMPDYTKVNNRINHDFFGEIVDVKVGYMFGNPISYTVDHPDSDMTVEERLKHKFNLKVNDFRLKNNIEDKDSETGKMATICGTTYRIYYIDQNGETAVFLPDPWEVVLIPDRSTGETQYAFRYYKMAVKEGNDFIERWRVEWYDRDKITYYIETKNGYELDPTELENPYYHPFDGVPVVEFANNDERQADGEKAFPEIDDYDRVVSDLSSEIEQFRLAYMIFKGYRPTKEDLDMMRQNGAFGIDGSKDYDAGIDFLTKDINIDAINQHLDRLEANILRFAKSVNFSDEQFAGNLSGVAMRYKIFALEAKSTTMERKFSAALREQFRLLCSVWEKELNMKLDHTNIWFEFKRNLPIDITTEVDASSKLKGLVSERTRLSLLPFIDNVDWELEEMERDRENSIRLNQDLFKGAGGGLNALPGAREGSGPGGGKDSEAAGA